MEQGYRQLLHKKTTVNDLAPVAKDKISHPRVISLGGDHSIVLPVLVSGSNHLDVYLYYFGTILCSELTDCPFLRGFFSEL